MPLSGNRASRGGGTQGFCFLGLWVALIVAPAPVRAQGAPSPAERRHVYSQYEEATIHKVLTTLRLVREDEPEGKYIERIVVVALDVFEPRDRMPQWFNLLHVTTRESVARDEVLLTEGEPYRQALVDDTIRNLRRFPGVPQLSVVLAVAAQGGAPYRVVLVIITKDVWSLRLNWNMVATPGGIERFELFPAETNFLGTHQIGNLHFVLEPSTYTFGAGYTIPRFGGTRVAVAARGDVMVNRQSGVAEGTSGSVVSGQPLFSGNTEWAWDANVGWSALVVRRYVDARPYEYVDPATGERLPFEYRSSRYTAAYEVTRSFGWDVNHDFTLGATIDRATYTTNFPGASPRAVADFARAYVPVSDTAVGPFLQYHSYRMRFVRVINFDTLALQEDYRLGHDIVLRLRPSFRGLGASRDVLGLYGAAQYTWAIRDGLLRVSVQSNTESEKDRIADASLQPTAHLVTPTIAGVGRVALDTSLLWRWRNYLNATTILGGDDRLRGYPTNFFVGKDSFSYNVEFRSRPIELYSCELGGVAFYDVGDAFASDRFVPYQSLGIGLRAVFPWLDRAVLRADLGFPLKRPLDPLTLAPIAPYAFLVSFGQAFATPTVSPASVLPTGQAADSP